MAQTMPSEGKCLFCGQTFSKSSIARHLSTHLAKMEAASHPTALHVQVFSGPYFIELLLPEKWTFGDLDSILRDIWLECCGHMSTFLIKGYRTWGLMEMDEDDIMDKELKSLYEPDLKMLYQYDFGSTTELDARFRKAYRIKFPDNAAWLLLSRNEPLPVLCDTCGAAPATTICSIFHSGGTTFCEACAEKHGEECEDFEYCMLPIVNSPRAGVCGYEGGMIDVERDGVFGH